MEDGGKKMFAWLSAAFPSMFPRAKPQIMLAVEHNVARLAILE
jgi:hypothetical protein